MVFNALEESDLKSIRVRRDSTGASGFLSYQPHSPCVIANAVEFLYTVTLPPHQ